MNSLDENSSLKSFCKLEGEDYISNFYRYKLFSKEKDMYLLTVDDGSFIFLNSSAFKQLKKGKIIDEKVYLSLVEKGIIVTETNFNDLVSKTFKRYSFLENGTSLHIVIPTNRCNQGCHYCFAEPAKIDANKEDNDMTEKTARKTIEYIMKSPSSAITIEYTGGEALIRFDLVKLMTLYAKELNLKYKKDLRITIVTNLTMMNEEMAQWLIDNDVTICTSLDGPKEIHNANRIILAKGGKEIATYDTVIFWIKKINEMYKKKGSNYIVNALPTITKYSLAYWKEIIDLYVELGMRMIDIRAMFSIGRGVEETKDPNFYTGEEFIVFYTKCLKYIEELRSKGVNINDRMKELYEVKVLENRPTYHADFESPWGAATGSVTYFNDGTIYACHEAIGKEEFKLGNIYEDSWKDIFNKKETAFTILSSMLEANPKCDADPYKPYDSTLPIENYYKFGKFNFYPEKTLRHFETKFHCDRIFNEVLKKI